MIQRSPLFLMANLGSEVSKIFSAHEKNNMEMLISAHRKAQEIISQIVLFPEMRSRIPEIEILSSVISDISVANPRFQVSQKNLKSYFYPFALQLMKAI